MVSWDWIYGRVLYIEFRSHILLVDLTMHSKVEPRSGGATCSNAGRASYALTSRSGYQFVWFMREALCKYHERCVAANVLSAQDYWPRAPCLFLPFAPTVSISMLD
jgi:hypothetical protein